MKQKKRKNSRADSNRAARKKRRRLFLAGVAVAILFLGIVIGLGWRRMLPVQDKSPRKAGTAVGQEQSFVGDFKVTRVIDGDTIEIEGGERVRYIGIDTPEAANFQKLAECFSQEASDKNKELVEGKIVRLENDTTDRDKYGRLLRYVYVGETFVNLQLVSEGFATIWVHKADIKYLKQLAKADAEAKGSARGLWSACPEEK